MFKKTNYIIIFSLYFGLLDASTYNYRNSNTNLDLLFDNNKLNSINFEYELDSGNDISGSIKLTNKLAIISLKSKNIEYQVLKNYFPKSSTKNNKKIQINWIIDKLKISDKYSLEKVTVETLYNGKFEKLFIRDKNGTFEYYIYPNKNGEKNLYGYSDNAGEILKARNISKDVVGGSLFIKGKYDSGSSYDAMLKIKNFSIKNNSKYENLIKTTRFFDLISLTQNKINNFSYMEVPLRKKQNMLHINDGFVDTIEKKTNIEGFYGPLYLFDKYASNIPILNKILTNKKNESILGANFSVTTLKGETSVTVNPLSLVTPGKTKRIFKIFNFLKKDKELNR